MEDLKPLTYIDSAIQTDLSFTGPKIRKQSHSKLRNKKNLSVPLPEIQRSRHSAGLIKENIRGLTERKNWMNALSNLKKSSFLSKQYMKNRMGFSAPKKQLVIGSSVAKLFTRTKKRTQIGQLLSWTTTHTPTF